MIVPANNTRLLSPDSGRILALPGGRSVVVARRVSRFGPVHDRGLGQTQQQLSNAAQAGAGGLVATLVATGAIAGPIGAAIGAGIGAVAAIVNALFQPNYNKIAAANDVNQIEPYLKQNLAAWLGLAPSQKYASVQAAAVATAQGWIAKMQQLCSQVPGSAGQNCISQRSPGGCGFHVAQPYGWINGQFVPSGPNDPTGQYCWDWGYYVDSIAKDPLVVSDPPLPTSSSVLASQLVTGTPVASAPGSSNVATASGLSLSSLPWWVWVLGLGALAYGVAQ